MKKLCYSTLALILLSPLTVTCATVPGTVNCSGGDIKNIGQVIIRKDALCGTVSFASMSKKKQFKVSCQAQYYQTSQKVSGLSWDIVAQPGNITLQKDYQINNMTSVNIDPAKRKVPKTFNIEFTRMQYPDKPDKDIILQCTIRNK